jgi:uncharacterized protein YbjT (DUF2867 family)
MRAVVFGSTGMVGQTILRECVLSSEVESVLVVVRASGGIQPTKVRELVHADFADFSAVADQLTGLDACFYCVGVSAVGRSEAEYTRVTHDFAIAAATQLARSNPGMTFVFVSAAGADSTERGRSMWARVKGRTENELLRMPFRHVSVFRPAGIQPLHGVVSQTKSYRILYAVTRPILPLARALFPGYVVTSEELGRAMLHAARAGAPRAVVEARDISALARRGR